MSYRAKTVAICLVVLFVVSLLAAAFAWQGALAPESGAGQPHNVLPVSAVDAAGGSGANNQIYILKDTEGLIAVFTPENMEVPVITSEIKTESLRATDKSRLQRGITVLGYDNVLKLLEDFSK